MAYGVGLEPRGGLEEDKSILTGSQTLEAEAWDGTGEGRDDSGENKIGSDEGTSNGVDRTSGGTAEVVDRTSGGTAEDFVDSGTVEDIVGTIGVKVGPLLETDGVGRCKEVAIGSLICDESTVISDARSRVDCWCGTGAGSYRILG